MGAQKKPGPFAAATTVVAKALSTAPVTSLPAKKSGRPFRAGKGKIFPRPVLHTAGFAQELVTSQAKHHVTPADVGVSTQKEFLALMRRSAGDVLTEGKVTSTAWLGRYIELAAPDMGPVQHMLLDHREFFRAWVNELVEASSKAPADPTKFVDGRFRRVTVTEKFRKGARVEDVWISPDGISPGKKYCDAMDLSSNADGYYLLTGHEYKSRSAAKELPGQIAAQRGRLRAQLGNPGAVITFRRADGSRDRLKLDQLVMVERGTEAKFNSRVAVKAGSSFYARLARDANGEPYLRVTAELPGARRLLDVMRDVLKKL